MLMFFLFGFTSYADAFYITVNKENPKTEISTKELRNYFIGNKNNWSGDLGRIKKIYLNEGTSSTTAFIKQIIKTNKRKYLRTLRRKMFSVLAMPPVKKDSDNEIFAYVKTYKSAIGIVSTNPVFDGIKYLKIND